MNRDGPRWHDRMSLRLRMVLIAAAAVAAVVAIGGVLIVFAVRAQLIDAADDLGEARADEIVDLAQEGELSARLDFNDDLEAAAQVMRGGQVVSATDNATSPRFFDLPEQRPGFDDVSQVARLPNDDDGPFRVTAIGTETPQGNATVYVAVDIEDIDEAVAALMGGGLVGLALLVVAVAGVCWIVIGRTLAPVDAISRQAEAITGHRLDARVPEPHAKDEVQRLARTINDMLTRLELSAKRQERFVADAAHELRTPLAGLRIRLETALARGHAGTDHRLLPDLLDETLRLSSLVDQLLLLARSDAGMLRTGARPVDIDDLVRDVVRSIQKDTVDVQLGAVEPVQVQGEPALLERVVRNLVDNAVRHARSKVEVSVTAEPQHAVLTVDDDGGGIPPHARSEVFRPFVRLDDSRQRAGGGVGLGLAIVEEIVRIHGGAVTVDDSPAAGARLSVRLPTG